MRHARSFDELAADVKAVTAEQLREFHARFYGAAHGEFAAVGDFDAAAVKQALAAGFGDWRSAARRSRACRGRCVQPTPTALVAAHARQAERHLLVQQPACR